MALRRMLSNVSGSRKSEMAAVKQEVHESLLVDIMKSEFQRHLPCFRGWQAQVEFSPR